MNTLENKFIHGVLFLLALCIMSNGTIFSISSLSYYSVIIFSWIFIMIYKANFARAKISLAYVFLIITFFISLVLNEIDPVFRAYERFLGYVSLIVLTSPLIYNFNLQNIRKTLLFQMMYICLGVVLISLIALYLGIVPLHSAEETHGGFRGITVQSMTLGPISSIGFLFSIYKTSYGLKKDINNKYHVIFYVICAIACFFTMLITGSRSTLASLCLGLIVYLFVLGGNKLSRIILYVFLLSILLISTFPLWENSLEVLLTKNTIAQEKGFFVTRSDYWSNRIHEFLGSPIFGIGMGTIDLSFSNIGWKFGTGAVEAGSSWMFLLSSTGVLGFIVFISIFFKDFKRIILYKDQEPLNGLYCAVLSFFFLHMFFEGYIFAVGNPISYILYLTLSSVFTYRLIYK